ncbi:MAG: hypothetical protein Q4B43_08075 [Bacteroidota bacterium]|nr:hypothetical protein [Bacteroidota bacterium]
MKDLLEKYFNGETSVEEEKELRVYFNSKHIDPEFEKYKPMFVYFQEATNEQFTGDKNIFLKPRKKLKYMSLSIAASFLIIVATSFFVRERNQVKEAQIAYHQVKEALFLISENYNKGIEKMIYLEEFDKTTAKIIKINN